MRTIALCVLIGLAGTGVAQQPGELDSLFHFDGKVVLTDFDSTSAPVIVPTADLGVVVAFQQTHEGATVSRMVKLKEDGSIDPLFGDSGIVTSISLGQFVDLVTESNGALLLVWKKTGGLIPQSTDIVIERFEPNGTVDPAYGNFGQCIIEDDTSTTGYEVKGAEMCPDERLLVYGGHWICAILPEGALDLTFGVQGLYVDPLDGISDVALSPNGRIWYVSAYDGPNELLPNGQGVATRYGCGHHGLGQCIHARIRINVSNEAMGYTEETAWAPGTSNWYGVGHVSDFHPYTNGSGSATSYRMTYFGTYSYDEYINGQLGPLATDVNGHFFLGMTFLDATGHDTIPNGWNIRRYGAPQWNQFGAHDTLFGDYSVSGPFRGVFTAFDSLEFAFATSMVEEPDGKLVVAGHSIVGSTDRIVLARYHNIPDPRAKLDLKVFLGGPMDTNTGLMHDSLRAQGLLPLQQPYQDSTFQSVNGLGAGMTSASVLNESGADAAVDWVWLELLDAADTATVVATRTGLLRRNGKVTSPINHDAIDFSVGAGSYFLRVRHRNHLGVTLSDPIALSNTVVSVDLSDPTTYTFGADAQKWMNGVHMLWPGDVNHDGLVRYAGAANDRDAVLLAIGGSPPTATSTGYKDADVNMDGIVKYAGVDNDRDVILQSIGGGYPTVVRFEQRP